MLGLAISAVGAIVAFSAFADVIHCNTVGYMMMIAGMIALVAGAMAMYSACYEKPWSARLVRGGI
jgi:hypothetical protein